MKNSRCNEKSGKRANTVNKYELANLILERNSEKEKLTVTAIQREYHQIQRELQYLRTEKNMLNESVGIMVTRRVNELKVHLKRTGWILNIAKPQFDSLLMRISRFIPDRSETEMSELRYYISVNVQK